MADRLTTGNLKPPPEVKPMPEVYDNSRHEGAIPVNFDIRNPPSKGGTSQGEEGSQLIPFDSYDTYFTVLWNMSINGVELDQERKMCITQIDIEENCDGSDTASFTVADPDMLFIEDNIFIEQASVSIEIYFEEDTHVIKFKGYISTIDIDFPENGTPTLNIMCLDAATHLMNRSKKSRSWEKSTSAATVERIAAEYGLKLDKEKGYSFEEEETISQSGETDIEFIEGLAKKEDEIFTCKIKENTVHYAQKHLLGKPIAELFYKIGDKDLISFSPRINKETHREEVEKADVDKKDKKKDKAKADKDTIRDVQGEPIVVSSFPMGTQTSADIKQEQGDKYVFDENTKKWVSG